MEWPEGADKCTHGGEENAATKSRPEGLDSSSLVKEPLKEPDMALTTLQHDLTEAAAHQALAAAKTGLSLARRPRPRELVVSCKGALRVQSIR